MDIDNRKKRLRRVIIRPNITIADAIKILDSSGLGILLVCDQMNRLLGVITDGDIRRAILKSISFADECISIANTSPVCSKEGIPVKDALYMMDHTKKFYVNHLPIVDSENRVVDLLLRRDFFEDGQVPLQAVVMAGGFGTRLYPLTENIPKPMLQVGDKPVLQHIIARLKNSGINNIKIATHYLSEKISDYFGDGENFSVKLEYINEDDPLGTAGALGLIGKVHEPLLIINGDILTDIDFRKMHDFHRELYADLTVGVRHYEFQVPYGVIECQGVNICGVSEKPKHQFFVNAGIYLIEPDVVDFIPKDVRYNMTDLIKNLIQEKKNVVSFPITEYWIDIGQLADLKRAQKDYINYST
ncbi:MAG: nucleotidyltransferase family protein [Candidatus Cloacimonadia bacterium]